MARPRKWNSEAERLAAYRKSKEEAVVDPDLPAVDVDEVPAPVTPIRTVSFTEDEYVRSSLDRPYLIDREAAERYARWRYRMFMAGEVAGL